MVEPRGRRAPGYEDYKYFLSQFRNDCGRCGTAIAIGTPVLGKPLDGRGWDIVCVSCGLVGTDGRVTSRGSAKRTRRASSGPGRDVSAASPERGDWMSAGGPASAGWSTLVRYLLLCVQQESLVAPVPLNERERWAVLPLRAETVLCGNDPGLPLFDELRRLTADLEEMEGVFYGWPTVVVEDDRGRPFVAPLFVRELGKPLDGGVDEASVPVGESLPQVNMGLLTSKWFSPELIAAAAAEVAEVVGFGLAPVMMALTQRLVAALGLRGGPLDPGALVDAATLGDPWRPEEVGVFNVVMAFKGKLDAATRGLIKDLQWMTRATDWRGSAARFLFEEARPSAASLPKSCAIELNDSQETALASAATAFLTVVTGPPGTGKSQTVAAIVADAWLRGETVLVTSTNNTPIDGVINEKMRPLDEALILRTGNADKRRELGARLRELVDRVPRRPLEATTIALEEASLLRHRASRTLEERARVEQAVVETAERRDRAREALWGEQQPRSDDLAMVRSLAEKACRTRWRWLRRRRAGACRERAGIRDPWVTADQICDWFNAEDSFRSAWQALVAFQDGNPVGTVVGFGEAEATWLLASGAATRTCVRERFVTGAEALKHLADVLTDELPRREAIERAMAYVPAWATSALSTRPNFDCRAGLIDLVVIDEASQCNLAQVLPLAYRAKRLVIVGDPQQLPPVVTANAQELRSLADQAGSRHDELARNHLTYEDSAYAAFEIRHGREPFLLEEHYRCHPEIIRFCNAQFYDNRLTVLTAVDRTDSPARGLEWRDVDGRTERGPTGSAINEAEALAVVEWLLASGLPPARVGVVTPFRAQAATIRKLLRQRGGATFDAPRIGTAHTFQGGECDTILFSTVIAPGALPGTIAWLEGERNLINVAVSRARRHLVVFGNRAELRHAKAATLLGLAAAATGQADHQDLTTSEAVGLLHAALVAVGLPAILGEVDEGYLLAIAMTAPDGERINIEVDEYPNGDPRGRKQRQSAIRDENLRRLGWQVVRVPGWQIYLDPAAAVELVRQVATL